MDINQLQQEQQMKQLEEMKRKLLTQMLTKEAYERLARVRAVNPQMAAQAELYLLNIFQSGKLLEPITDGKLRDILQALTEKKEFKVRRK
jgi:DNA-binding TFAR19-related protein (PDSD5 family)